MKKAVISGFGLFGSYMSNPTGKIAKELNFGTFGDHYIYGKEIPANVFPLNGQKVLYGELLVRLAIQEEACCIVSLGIDSSAKGFRIESTARNLIYNEKYCPPRLNGQPVLEERPFGEKVEIQKGTIDFFALRSRFSKAGIPMESELSKDAGGYCCNALMYMVLRAQARLKHNIPFVFCHVPCTKESVKDLSGFDSAKTLITEEQIKEGLRQILLSYT